MYKIIGADGNEYGPVTADQVKQWIADGRANGQTRVLPEGGAEWRMLAEIPELAVALPLAPAAPSVPMPPAEIPNYLVQAILVTLCCCVPFGIVAIVYAAQVKTKLAGGDLAGAQDSSRKAKLWCWIGFGSGLVGGLIYILIQVVFVGLGAAGHGF